MKVMGAATFQLEKQEEPDVQLKDHRTGWRGVPPAPLGRTANHGTQHRPPLTGVTEAADRYKDRNSDS